jgi:hypothetical protein
MLKINAKFAVLGGLLLAQLTGFVQRSEAAVAQPPRRISSKYVDRGRPQTIYMVAGMATLIELPTPINQVRVGNADDVQYTKPDQPENEITLFLKSAQAKPTNLFLISGKSKYIFDIVPSKSIHQDYIEIIGSFGGPEYEESPDNHSEVIDSSDLPAKKQVRGQAPSASPKNEKGGKS